MKTNENRVAFFAALSAFIGIFESFIPLPIPFFRLGFANIPVCLGFSLFSFSQMAYIIAFKVILVHLFRGSIFSYPFLLALSGNLLLLLGVYPFYKMAREKISFISVNVLAAFLHNTGQIAVSFLFLPFSAVIYYSVFMIFLGTIFSLINGIICNKLYNNVIIRIFT